MILNNLFTLDQIQLHENKVEAVVHLDEQHEILKGHFPQQPVVPGVCMIELVKELLEQGLQCKLFMHQAPVAKFLTMLAPPHFTQATCQLKFQWKTPNELQVDGQLNWNEHIFLKLKASYLTR
jgi:3-hydroxyacyl-[acyl-carrier-protein] dehydratase